jgi:DNA-binding response OmpR family regulator
MPSVDATLREGGIAVDRWGVLVVESDGAVRGTLVEGLSDAGLMVEASAAADASIDEWRGDVIVTDTFASPYRIDAAVAYLNELRSRFAVPVIVLTGHSEAGADADRLPADAVIMKPFDLDDLVEVIRRVVRNGNGRQHSPRER